jgi:hypothetical protein
MWYAAALLIQFQMNALKALSAFENWILISFPSFPFNVATRECVKNSTGQ